VLRHRNPKTGASGSRTVQYFQEDDPVLLELNYRCYPGGGYSSEISKICWLARFS
jgi:hypothetical protein